jgi:hypothetical protein
MALTLFIILKQLTEFHKTQATRHHPTLNVLNTNMAAVRTSEV